MKATEVDRGQYHCDGDHEHAPLSTQPKFCRDCRWAKVSFADSLFFPFRRWQFARCLHPSAQDDVDYYTDGRSDNAKYCATQRLHDCGPEARYFEPRP